MSSTFEHFLKVDFLSNDSPKEEYSDIKFCGILPFADSAVHYTKIISATCLSKGADVKTVYEVALDAQNVENVFEPGGTIGIIPCNDENEVKQLIERLNLLPVCQYKYKLSILPERRSKKSIIPPHIPTYGNLFEVFLKHLDIRSFPKKAFLRCLIQYTSNQDEIKRLQWFCSPSGAEDYKQFFLTNKGLLSFLTIFSSCQPSVECLLEHLPPLFPRPYSISSSPLLKTAIHFIFDVVDFNNGTKGVCSGWLENIIKNLSLKMPEDCDVVGKLNQLSLNVENEIIIPFYFRTQNHFKLPTDPLLPIIMIATGTGVAPFLGFLEHRHIETKNKNKTFGSSWLLYGCRYSNKDFLHKSKIEEYLASGVLTELFTSYSRENCTKTYVQNTIKNKSKEFVNKITCENVIIYVCGNAKMVKDVKDTVISCLADNEQMSTADAELYIKQLEKDHRYVQDIWL